MNNDELFDIVDEHNQPTGERLPRARVHAEGLWHRTVHVYFYRLRQSVIEILVHLRDKEKDLHPNKWDTRFGGHLGSGQSYAEALSREIEEETGVQLTTASVIEGPERKRDKYPNREFTKVYFYEYNGGVNELQFKDGEVQEAKWMSLDEIEDGLKNNPDQWSGGYFGFHEIVEQLRKIKAL